MLIGRRAMSAEISWMARTTAGICVMATGADAGGVL
jgi:hypothetical protein